MEVEEISWMGARWSSKLRARCRPRSIYARTHFIINPGCRAVEEATRQRILCNQLVSLFASHMNLYIVYTFNHTSHARLLKLTDSSAHSSSLVHFKKRFVFSQFRFHSASGLHPESLLLPTMFIYNTKSTASTDNRSKPSPNVNII